PSAIWRSISLPVRCGKTSRSMPVSRNACDRLTQRAQRARRLFALRHVAAVAGGEDENLLAMPLRRQERRLVADCADPALKAWARRLDPGKRCVLPHPDVAHADRAVGAEAGLELIGVLLRELVVGSTRFNDLRRGVPRMSPALLSKRLKDLETAGIVTRSPVVGEPGAF